MFFGAIDGSLYPTATIVKIGAQRTAKVKFGDTLDTREVHDVELADGDTVQVHAFQMANLLRRPVAAFPAAVGTYIVSRADGVISKWPVIGWSISTDGGVYPVTMNGVNSDMDQLHHVLLPSGEITTYDDAWASITEWGAEQP